MLAKKFKDIDNINIFIRTIEANFNKSRQNVKHIWVLGIQVCIDETGFSFLRV